jgi:hypothetical protein
VQNPPRFLSAVAVVSIASAALPAAAQMRAQAGAGLPAVFSIGGAYFPSAGAWSISPAATSLSAALVAPALAAAAPAVLAAHDGVSAIFVPTPGAAGTRIADEAAANAQPQVPTPNPEAPKKKKIVARILEAVRGRPAASIGFDGDAGRNGSPSDAPAATPVIP